MNLQPKNRKNINSPPHFLIYNVLSTQYDLLGIVRRLITHGREHEPKLFSDRRITE